MMAINLNMAFISPPVGFSLFYLQSVAPEEVKTADIHKGALPFMALQSFGLMVVAYLPETVIGLLEFFEFTNPIDLDFVPGSFGVRLSVTLAIVAVSTAVWAVYGRSRYNRQLAAV